MAKDGKTSGTAGPGQARAGQKKRPVTDFAPGRPKGASDLWGRVPFALFGKTSFLAERVLGNVMTSGIKLMVLAIVVGIGSTLFGTLTAAPTGDITL